MPTEQPHVLIADGDPEMVNHVLDILERDTYRVLVARDKNEAVQVATSHHTDLLLLDIELPGGGGYAVVEALRDHPLPHQPGVIFLARLDQPEQIRQGFEAGAVDYITKPFSSAQLRARIRTWLLRLDKHHSPPTGEDGSPPPPPCAAGPHD